MTAKAPSAGLSAIETAVKTGRGGPDTWNPPFCGDLDMRIAADGTWFYLGSPIGRKPLVKLFSSILRCESDGRFYLVTPIEKCGITVDDAPYVAVEMRVEGEGENRVLHFRTNTDEWTAAGDDHPLRFARDVRGALKPYVHVRKNLEALIARAVFYDLVELGEERDIDGERVFGIRSGGVFFPMERAAVLNVSA